MAYEEISPVSYPITLIKNDDWNREIEIFQSDGSTGFVFSGWSAKAQVREDDTSTSALITFSTSAGTLTLATGKLTLIAAKANTDIDPGVKIWDCEFTDSDGKQRTLIKPSNFTITEDVTVL